MLFVGPAKKVLKPRAAPAKKPSHGSSGSSERKGEARPKPEPRKAPIPPTMKIFDAADNEVVVQSVAKHMESIPLESLGGAGIDPANLPFPLPHGTNIRIAAATTSAWERPSAEFVSIISSRC